MKSNFNDDGGQMGRRVVVLRKLNGMSQEELAFRAEIDRTYISQIVRGVCHPSLWIMRKISRALEIESARNQVARPA